MKTQTFLLLSLVFSLSLNAEELRMSRAEALKKGFKPQARSTERVQESEIPKNTIPWPVNFFSSSHTIGNSAPEFQNYGGESYFHSGCDLRVKSEAPVFSPVSGFLRAHYYTYVTDPQTGEDKKFTKPLTEGGDPLYFEVSIETSDGLKFELHHVNPRSLPQGIRQMAIDGGGSIESGVLVGRAVVWPIFRQGFRYDHIHYNILDQRGNYLNPEFLSQLLPDDRPPEILNLYSKVNGKIYEVEGHQLNERPTEIIVSAVDYRGSGVFPLPPVSVQLLLDNEKKIGWDFSIRLAGADGLFPDIREVYARNIKLVDGRRITTLGDYENTVFLFRLKVPDQAEPPFRILVQDSAGHKKEIFLKK